MPAPPFDALVLCGGRSTRMGRDKASLPFGQETLLARVLRLVSSAADRIVISAAPGQLVPAGHEVSRDETGDEGPLAGVLGSLGLIRRGHVFVVACDMPLIQPALPILLAELCAGWDGAVPLVHGTRVPTCAVYEVAALRQHAARFGPARNRSLQDFLTGLRVRDVPPEVLRQADPSLLSLTPCNTPEEYRRALALAATNGTGIATDDADAQIEGGLSPRRMRSTLEALLESDGLATEFQLADSWVEFVEHVVETLDVGPGTSVFDVQCGAGAFLFPLSQNGYRVGGVDTLADHIARAAAAMPEGRFGVGRPVDVDPAEGWDVVVASRGFAGCDDLDDSRALLARIVAKATHAIAVLRIEEGVGSADRAVVLRLLAEIGVSAVQFEDTADGRLHVYAKV